MEKFKYLKKERISKLPKSPGIYAFKKDGGFLYIGKAANIRERVKNHFQQPIFRDNLFINQTRKIGYIKTDSEIEALILEANLIKKHQPKYNIVWRDDKNYFYVEITKEEYPRVSIVHQKKEKNHYIGPFVEGASLKRTLAFLRKAFPYYTARRHKKGRCLWCSLKLCPGPNPDKKEYKKNIKNLIAILKGKSRKVLNILKKEMKRLSFLQDYEKAGRTRDQIRMMEKVISHYRVLEPALEEKPSWRFKRIEAYDVSNIQGNMATGSMVAFIDSRPNKSFYRKFRIKISGKPNDTAMLKEVIQRRLKHQEWPYPDLILIDGGKAQLNTGLQCLKHIKKKIKIMALAKKENMLYVENKKKPVPLKTLPKEISNLILRLRDEAHRFAISYHKKLRERHLLEK